jgi:K+-transporting ATPase ATPase B chain
VVVDAGELVPGDGEVIEGVASVDESAITGESAPVIRESGGDRSAVTGGTRVLSDRIVIKITSDPGQTFLDRMIALVEGATRQKTPNEIALHILLVGMTIVFLLACVTLVPLARIRRFACRHGDRGIAGLPDSHHHRRSAFGHRHRRHGSPDPQERHRHERSRHRGGRRRGPAARQDRHHHHRQPHGDRVHARSAASVEALADAAQLASLADETPEGRSIVVLAKEKFNLRGRDVKSSERNS